MCMCIYRRNHNPTKRNIIARFALEQYIENVIT